MNLWLRRSFGASLSLVLVGLVACGGGSGPGAGEAGKPTQIASMPPYPPPNENKPAPAPEVPKPKDPKTICAGAGDVKLSFGTSTDDGALEAGRADVRAIDDRKAGFASFGAFAGHAANAKESTYSMADLQALEKKGAWEELLGHAEDVAPTQRGATWEKLVEKAAIGYMQQLTTNTAAFEGVFTSQSLLKRYPHLLKSQEFMTKRGEAGKAASEICLRESYRGQHCIDMMKDFLKTSNTGADVGFAFGKITRRNQNHYVAVPFFKWALDQKKDAAMCADEDLKLAVVAGLGLPPDYENALGARQIAANACWDSLRPAIEKQLAENDSGYYRDNACAVMKAKGAL